MPTAIMTAYPKTLTDIPYSLEIFNHIKKINGGEIKPAFTRDDLAPVIEARHKLTDKMVRHANTSQILDIASGFSPRGLSFSALPNAVCVEIDLPEMAEMKKGTLNSFTKIPDNLHILGGNALNYDDIAHASDFFNPNKNVAIVAEGLLRYLDFNEKAMVANNVRRVLEKFCGVWISCDFTLKQYLLSQNHNIKNHTNNIVSVTNNNLLNNSFEDIKHIVDFFANLGFDMEFHEFDEVMDELVSPKQLDYSPDRLTALFRYAHVATMKLR